MINPGVGAPLSTEVKNGHERQAVIGAGRHPAKTRRRGRIARMLSLPERMIDKLYADAVVHRTEPFNEP
jgi:hypothetical protein